MDEKLDQMAVNLMLSNEDLICSYGGQMELLLDLQAYEGPLTERQQRVKELFSYRLDDVVPKKIPKHIKPMVLEVDYVRHWSLLVRSKGKKVNRGNYVTLRDLAMKLKEKEFLVDQGCSCLKIRFSNQQERWISYQQLASQFPQFDWHIPKLVNPVVKLLISRCNGVNHYVRSGELLTKLAQENSWLDKDQVKVEFYIFKTNHDILLLSLTPEMYSLVTEMEERYLFLDGKKYQVYDNLNIKFCINCSQFGHLEKNCVNEPKCYKCSESHTFLDCSSITLLCPSCGTRGHSGLDRACKVFISRVNLALERINFNYKCLILEPDYESC